MKPRSIAFEASAKETSLSDIAPTPPDKKCIIAFSLPIFPEASYFFTPLVYTLSIVGVIYTSLTAIRQTDLKRIIAYTSVAHMNLVVMGLFCFNTVGLEGAIIQSISHGFVSSALFLVIGVVYDRHHTRMVKYYSGLVHTMPLFVTIFLLFSRAVLIAAK